MLRTPPHPSRLDPDAAAATHPALFGLQFEPMLEQAFTGAYLAKRRAAVAWGLAACLLLALASLAANPALLLSALHPGLGTLWALTPQLALVLGALGLLALLGLRRDGALYAAISPWLVAATLALLAYHGAIDPGAPDHDNEIRRLLIVLVCAALLTGMPFRCLLATDAVALAIFAIVGLRYGSLAAQTIVDCGHLAAVIAACSFASFRLEREARTEFLQRRMLEQASSRDPLTGLENRRTLDQQLQQRWALALREHVFLGLIMVDIDCFKNYNDRYGHQAGDECLRRIAAALRRFPRRPLDLAARYGGEEFAILLYDLPKASVEAIIDRLRTEIADLAIPHDASTVASTVTVSIGVAHMVPTMERSAAGLIQMADESLYAAKHHGRNRAAVNAYGFDGLRTGHFRIAPAPRETG